MASAYTPMSKDGTSFPAYRPDRAASGFPILTNVVSNRTAVFPASGMLAVYHEGQEFHVASPDGDTSLQRLYPQNTLHYFSGAPGSDMTVRGSAVGSTLLHIWEITSA